MKRARLDEFQAGIKIGRRNINSLRCVGDITLMAESEEKLKSLLMRIKEESERVGLRQNVKTKTKTKTNIMASGPIAAAAAVAKSLQLCPTLHNPVDSSPPASCPITAWQIEKENVEVVTDFLLLGSKITVDGDYSQIVAFWQESE